MDPVKSMLVLYTSSSLLLFLLRFRSERKKITIVINLIFYIRFKSTKLQKENEVFYLECYNGLWFFFSDFYVQDIISIPVC